MEKKILGRKLNLFHARLELLSELREIRQNTIYATTGVIAWAHVYEVFRY